MHNHTKTGVCLKRIFFLLNSLVGVVSIYPRWAKYLCSISQIQLNSMVCVDVVRSFTDKKGFPQFPVL